MEYASSEVEKEDDQPHQKVDDQPHQKVEEFNDSASAKQVENNDSSLDTVGDNSFESDDDFYMSKEKGNDFFPSSGAVPVKVLFNSLETTNAESACSHSNDSCKDEEYGIPSSESETEDTGSVMDKENDNDEFMQQSGQIKRPLSSNESEFDQLESGAKKFKECDDAPELKRPVPDTALPPEKDAKNSSDEDDNEDTKSLLKQMRHMGTSGLSVKPKVKNLRRNIRDIISDDKLEKDTLAAQKEEQLRLQRLQEKKIALKEYMEQQEVEWLVAEVTSNLEAETKTEASEASNLLLLGENSESCIKEEPIDEETVKIKKESDLDEVSIVQEKKVIKEVKEIDSKEEKISTSEDEEESDISSESDDSDIVILSDHSEDEDGDDVNNSGAHVNDALNVPDVQGRVLVNVGHPENEQDIFLAPQLSQIVKPHQIGGIRFLYDNIVESLEQFKSSNGFGCILAHAMGLGKTLQVVAFTDVFLRYTGAKLVLIIVPINTIQNWQAEFNQWLPGDSKSNLLVENDVEIMLRQFKVFILNDGVKSMKGRAAVINNWYNTGGVLLMGYELYRQLSLKKPKKPKKKKKSKRGLIKDVVDIEEEDKDKELLDEMQKTLVRPGPDLVICDEGHRIKNAHANISQALKNIRTRRRIVLTGYPLQNNLLEYWCMVDFVRPNYLGTKMEFCNMFERPIQNGQCVDSTPQDVKLMRYRAHVLHSLLEGFVQRRGHAVLANTLPQKEENVVLCRMTPIQRKLYSTFMSELVANKTVANPLKAFAVCCKIWNHPDVLYNFVMKRINEDFDLDLDEVQQKKLKGVKGLDGQPLTMTNGPSPKCMPPFAWNNQPGQAPQNMSLPQPPQEMFSSGSVGAPNSIAHPYSQMAENKNENNVTSGYYHMTNYAMGQGGYGMSPYSWFQHGYSDNTRPPYPPYGNSFSQYHNPHTQNLNQPVPPSPPIQFPHTPNQMPSNYSSQTHQNPSPGSDQPVNQSLQATNELSPHSSGQMFPQSPSLSSADGQQPSSKSLVYPHLATPGTYMLNNDSQLSSSSNQTASISEQQFGNIPSNSFSHRQGNQPHMQSDSHFTSLQNLSSQSLSSKQQENYLYNSLPNPQINNLMPEKVPSANDSSQGTISSQAGTFNSPNNSPINQSCNLSQGNDKFSQELSSLNDNSSLHNMDYNQQCLRSLPNSNSIDSVSKDCNPRRPDYSTNPFFSSTSENLCPSVYVKEKLEAKLSENYTLSSKMDNLKMEETEVNDSMVSTSDEKEVKKDELSFDWAEKLFKDYTPGLLENSNKFQIFFKILENTLQLKDRLLVFSQSLFTLSLLEEFLQKMQIAGTEEFWAKNRSYFRLDGSTSAQERERLINEFNSNASVYLFLISTRAGSLGINLVGANRVIVFDASFNPCHDTQAVCRVYRYGQQKECFIYRLVTDNSLEKRIYDRQINKQGISDRIVDELNPDAHLYSKEISNLLVEGEEDPEAFDLSDKIEEFNDCIIKLVIKELENGLTKVPFKHESLLVDRQEKRLSSAEKRLAKRSYELEKQANINYNRSSYSSYYPKTVGAQQTVMMGTKIGGIVYAKPVGTVRPLQAEMGKLDGNMMHRPNILSRSHSNFPVESLAKQGVSVQQITVPKDLSIPTNSGDGKPITLHAGQSVMVIKTQKGMYLRLADGKIVAIRVPPGNEDTLGLPLNQASVTIVPSMLSSRARQNIRPTLQRRGRPPLSASYSLGSLGNLSKGSGPMSVRILRKPIVTSKGKSYQTIAVPVSTSSGSASAAFLNKSVVITPASKGNVSKLSNTSVSNATKIMTTTGSLSKGPITVSQLTGSNSLSIRPVSSKSAKDFKILSSRSESERSSAAKVIRVHTESSSQKGNGLEDSSTSDCMFREELDNSSDEKAENDDDSLLMNVGSNSSQLPKKKKNSDKGTVFSADKLLTSRVEKCEKSLPEETERHDVLENKDGKASGFFSREILKPLAAFSSVNEPITGIVKPQVQQPPSKPTASLTPIQSVNSLVPPGGPGPPTAAQLGLPDSISVSSASFGSQGSYQNQTLFQPFLKNNNSSSQGENNWPKEVSGQLGSNVAQVAPNVHSSPPPDADFPPQTSYSAQLPFSSRRYSKSGISSSTSLPYPFAPESPPVSKISSSSSLNSTNQNLLNSDNSLGLLQMYEQSLHPNLAAHHNPLEYLSYSDSSSAFRRPDFPAASISDGQPPLASPQMPSSLPRVAQSSSPSVTSESSFSPQTHFPQYGSSYASQSFQNPGYPPYPQYSPYPSQYPSFPPHSSVPTSQGQFSSQSPYQPYPPVTAPLPPYSGSLSGFGHGIYPPM